MEVIQHPRNVVEVLGPADSLEDVLRSREKSRESPYLNKNQDQRYNPSKTFSSGFNKSKHYSTNQSNLSVGTENYENRTIRSIPMKLDRSAERAETEMRQR